jgi:hypothetical protein
VATTTSSRSSSTSSSSSRNTKTNTTTTTTQTSKCTTSSAPRSQINRAKSEARLGLSDFSLVGFDLVWFGDKRDRLSPLGFLTRDEALSG